MDNQNQNARGSQPNSVRASAATAALVNSRHARTAYHWFVARAVGFGVRVDQQY